MFRQVSVPILGIVENMSWFICGSCGHEAHIFGQGGAARTAADMGMELLGQVRKRWLLAAGVQLRKRWQRCS